MKLGIHNWCWRARLSRAGWLCAAALLFGTINFGCAAVTNPVSEGIPVRRLPAEYLAASKEDSKSIPMTLLRQKVPDVYLLESGDILGVYIEGIVGDKTQPVPVRFPEQGNQSPGLGYPIPVREHGTVPLPMIPPVNVKGLSIVQAQDLIQKLYTIDNKLLAPGRERILVSLLRPRQYHVQVVRQDSANVAIGGTGGAAIGSTHRGTGAAIDLPAYENDVLNALTRTGGLPGLDALNEIMIQRDPPPGSPHGADQVVRIPLRMRQGEPLPFRPDDIVLKNGDIVFIEARDTEVYYTGGLLFPRQFTLPRDYDLRLVDAIALGGGPLVNGGQNQNNLSGTLIASGLGGPSPSRVAVLRRTAHQGQITIKVDLNLALTDPRENILVQAGDVIILQETPGEAITRYLTGIIQFNLFGTFARQRDFVGATSVIFP